MKSQPTSAINKISDLNSVNIYESKSYLGSGENIEKNATY